MTQTKVLILVAAGGLLMGTGTARAVTGEEQAAPPATEAVSAKLITATAKVVKVDAKTRELTLKDENDKPFTINVPEDISRLDNVKPGDRLNVSFYESVAVSLAKPGEAATGRVKSTTTGRTAGTLPGGGVAQQITTTAKITKIDPSMDELTIEGPEGKANTIKVSEDARPQLSRLKVGDKVQTTYTQAMATRVTPAHAM
jgi:Cu/Ag efflux protein CusF